MLQRVPSRTYPTFNAFRPRPQGQEIFWPFEVMRRMGAETEASQAWTPRVDIRETGDAFLIEVELPGMSKKDVEITVEKQVLTLSGERTLEPEEGTYHRNERFAGKFRRSFTLPRNVDAGRVQARFKDGLLTLSVPKQEEAKPRSISID